MSRLDATEYHHLSREERGEVDAFLLIHGYDVRGHPYPSITAIEVEAEAPMRVTRIDWPATNAATRTICYLVDEVPLRALPPRCLRDHARRLAAPFAGSADVVATGDRL